MASLRKLLKGYGGGGSGLTGGMGSTAPSNQSGSNNNWTSDEKFIKDEPCPLETGEDLALSDKWSTSVNPANVGQKPVLSYNHGQYGVVSVHKIGPNHFAVRHNGAVAGLRGHNGAYSDISHAVQHAQAYTHALDRGAVASKPMIDTPSSRASGTGFAKSERYFHQLLRKSAPVAPEKNAFDLHHDVIATGGDLVGGTVREDHTGGSARSSVHGGSLNREGSSERFHYAGLVWDIDAIRDFFGKETSNAEVTCTRDWSRGINLDKDAAMKSKSEKPVIIATLPLDSGHKHLLIDGHHRMYRNCKMGVAKLAALILSPEDTLKFMETYPDLMAKFWINVKKTAPIQKSEDFHLDMITVEELRKRIDDDADEEMHDFHGWIDPEGNHLWMNPEQTHGNFIADHLGMNSSYVDGPEWQRAYSSGYIGIGHGGEANISIPKHVLDDPNHPAHKALRRMTLKRGFPKKAIVHIENMYEPSTSRHNVDMKHFGRTGRIRSIDPRSAMLAASEDVKINLEKRSKNVREQTRDLSTEKRNRRLRQYAGKLGFRVSSADKDSRRDQFGVGEDQRGINLSAATGMLEHEIAHAIMTPTGMSLREEQKRLGHKAMGQSPEAHAAAIRQEHVSFDAQPMIERRAGVSQNNNGYYRHIKRTPTPEYVAHRAEGAAHLRTFEEGRKILNPKGRMVPGTSIHAKINERGLRQLLGKAESLDKSKNVREKRQETFGGWKTTPDSPKRAKQMRTLKQYAETKYNTPVRRAKGKETTAGQMIDKPDLRTGFIEHIGNPDSFTHELAHLDVAPEGQDLTTYQENMDRDWSRANVEHGYKQQSRIAAEYETIARENEIRRQLGLPAHAKTRKISRPEQAYAADRPGQKIVREIPGKTITGGSEVISPETRELIDRRESSAAHYTPEAGWSTKPSLHTAINLRGQGRFAQAADAAKAYFQQLLQRSRLKEAPQAEIPRRLAASEDYKWQRRAISERQRKKEIGKTPQQITEEVRQKMIQRDEAAKAKQPKQDIKKSDEELAKEIRSPRAGHTIRTLRSLKQDNWHNPDTGTEISPEEGNDYLQRLENRAAERKVISITEARKRFRNIAKPSTPEDWAGIISPVKKAELLMKNPGFRDEQHLREFLANGRYALITPHRTEATAQENAHAHDQFKKELQTMGYQPIPAKGRWGGSDEPTYIVPNMSREHAIQLGQKYGQQAVIHGQAGHHEEIATHQSYKPMGHGTGFDLVPHEEDNHTEIPLEGGGKAKFRLHFGQELSQ